MGVENNNDATTTPPMTTTPTTTTTTTTTGNANTITVLKGRLQLSQQAVARLQAENEALRRENLRLRTEQDHVVSLETQVTFCMEDFRREKEEHEKVKARSAELQMELDILKRQLKSYQATTLSQLSVRRQAALDSHRQRYEQDNQIPTYRSRRPHSSYLTGGTYARDSPGVIQCDSAADDGDDVTGNNAGDFDEIDGAFAATSPGRHSPSDMRDTLDGELYASRTPFRFANTRGATLPSTRSDDVVPMSSSPSRHGSSSSSSRRSGSSQPSPLSSPSNSVPASPAASSSEDSALECPRCHDKFPFELHVAFLDHLDACTSY